MEKLDLCIFDVDGLLIDTERYVWYKAQKVVCKKLGYDVDHDFIISMIGKKQEECESEIAEKLGKGFPFEEYNQNMYDYYYDVITNDTIPVKEGVFNLLNYLNNKHIPCAIGTCTIEKYSKMVLEKVGLMKYFDYAVYGDSVSKSKPNPEVYNKSIEHFNTRSENCLIFEDSLNGAKTVYNANANLVFVPDLVMPSEVEYQKAFKIIKQIDDIIPTIEEILNYKY